MKFKSGLFYSPPSVPTDQGKPGIDPKTGAISIAGIEKVVARQFSRQVTYNSAAAQPTYGFVASEAATPGRLWEILRISASLADPFNTGITNPSYINVSSTTPAAANNITLAAAAGTRTWITGFEITGLGATAASTVAITVNNVQGGPLTYYLTIPAGVTTTITSLVIEYGFPGIPANADNTTITVLVPSFGAGNTTAAVVGHGYQSVTPGIGPSWLAYISTTFPQDSNTEPANFPDLAVTPQTLPSIISPPRRQILLHGQDRVIFAIKNLANSSRADFSLSIVEYDISEFLSDLKP
jgi:hypothetical protein